MHIRAMLLGSSALAAAAIVLAGPAAAQDLSALEKRVAALEKTQKDAYVHRSKRAMKLTVSGFINRLVQYRDNGTNSGIVHVTPITSRSRVRWIGDGQLTDDISVRTNIELGNRSGSSSQQTIATEGDNNGAANQDPFDERHLDIIFTSKTLGKLWIGQGPAASETVSERDLSGTAILTLNGDAQLLASAEPFFNNGVNTGVNVNNVFGNFDGFSRRDRLRYDTPSFAGFFLSTSHMNGDDWDAAMYYQGELGGVKIDGAIAYGNQNAGGAAAVGDRWNGSLSVLLPMGLSLTGGWANFDFDQAGLNDGKWYYGKVGYRFKALEMGETRLAVEYSRNRNEGLQNTKGTMIGLALVQMLEPLGAEFQLGYHNFDARLPGGIDPDNIHVVSTGVRVSF